MGCTSQVQSKKDVDVVVEFGYEMESTCQYKERSESSGSGLCIDVFAMRENSGDLNDFASKTLLLCFVLHIKGYGAIFGLRSWLEITRLIGYGSNITRIIRVAR